MTVTRLVLTRVRAALADMAYANNRRLELQTGSELTPETAHRRARREIAALTTAYEREAASDSPTMLSGDHGLGAELDRT